MKRSKLMTLALCMLLYLSGCFAGFSADKIDASFKAKRLEYYAPNNLTITHLYGALFMDDITCDSAGMRLYDILLAVNGQDVNKMSDDELNKLLWTSSRVDLTIISSVDWNEHTFSYTPINLDLEGRNELFENAPTEFFRIHNNNERLNMRVNSDLEVDFSQYKTIDILFLGDDLREKSIAKQAMNTIIEKSHFPIKRDTENPDLLITVACDERHSVSSTYVPPTTSYVDQGSYSTVTKTKSGFYVNTFKRPPLKKTEGGYNVDQTSTYHYVEITVLDTKKMLDPATQSAPIVWQLVYDKTFDYAENFNRIINTYVMDNLKSFPHVSRFDVPWSWYSGICWQEHAKKSIIADVMKNSPAEKMGLKAGDEILKINNNKHDALTLYTYYDSKCIDSKKEYKTVDFLGDTFYTYFYFGKVPFYKAVARLKTYGPQYAHFFYQNQYVTKQFDKLEFDAPKWMYDQSEVEVLVKRNGKKLKLKGVLYDLMPAYWYGL